MPNNDSNSDGFCIFTDSCVFPIGPGAWQDPDVPPEIAKLWQEASS